MAIRRSLFCRASRRRSWGSSIHRPGARDELYGLVVDTVSRRVKELGIRIALGARHRDVVWLVERRGLILAGAGIAIGAGLAAAAAPLLSAGFPGLGVSSPAVYALAALVLLMVSAVASYLPARRAAGLDPLPALRNE